MIVVTSWSSYLTSHPHIPPSQRQKIYCDCRAICAREFEIEMTFSDILYRFSPVKTDTFMKIYILIFFYPSSEHVSFREELHGLYMIQKLVYSRGNKTATSFLDWMKTEQKKLQTGTAKPATKRKKNVFVRMTKPKYKLSSLNLRGVELNGTWKRFASDKIFTLKKVSPRVVWLPFCSTLAAHVWLWKQTFFSIFFCHSFFLFLDLIELSFLYIYVTA